MKRLTAPPPPNATNLSHLAFLSRRFICWAAVLVPILVPTDLHIHSHALVVGVGAFTPPTQFIWKSPCVSLRPAAAKHSSRLYEKSKGFGKSSNNKSGNNNSNNNAFKEDLRKPATSTGVEYPMATPATSTTSTTSAGEEALARLRRQKAEERNEELRRIRELKSVDKLLNEEPNAAVIPERVAQRMGRRMLPFVGIPLFGVMGCFVTFWYLATYKNYEFQPALVAFSTIGVLGLGLLGITYSVMSASWDEEEEGSALGVDEFQKNLKSLQEGLKRTRENAILREKMSSLPPEEIDDALQRLEKKEQAEMKKTMNLKERLEKDLE